MYIYIIRIPYIITARVFFMNFVNSINTLGVVRVGKLLRTHERFVFNALPGARRTYR